MIELHGRFTATKGHVYGLQQPAVLSMFRIVAAVADDLPGLEDWMACFLEEMPPALAPDAPTGPESRLVHRCVRWAIALQRQVRIPVSERFLVQRKTAAGGDLAAFLVAVPCAAPRATTASLAWAADFVRRFVAGAREPGPEDRAAFDACSKALRRDAASGLNPYYIETAAYALDLPVRTFSPGVLAVGAGWTSRLFRSTITDRTPSIGVMLAKNKRATSVVLRAAGLPGGENALVKSAEGAVRAAEQLGYPVVVKPADRDQGQGVAADLRDAGAVARAFEDARGCSENVLVERHVDGFTHRLTVFDGRLVKAAKRVAGGVVGDGVRTIAQLAEEAGQTPERRRMQARTNRVLLTIDEEAEGLLAQSGRSAASIPAAGEYVRLRRRDNRNAGGSNVAVPLEAVHPDNRALAIRAAALLRLDFAGIDLIIEDIGRSWLDIGGLICEVNAQPQMGTADTPTIYQELLAGMVPDGGRIPIHLALCAGVAIAPADAIAEVQQREPCSLVAHAGGLWMNGTRIARGFGSGFDALRAALELPEAREILCAMTAEEVGRRGLPIDRIDRLSVVGTPDDADGGRAMLDRAVAVLGGHFRKTQRI